MKRLSILLLIIWAPIYSVEWSNYNMNVVSESQTESQKNIVLSNVEGKQLTIIYNKEISESSIKNVLTLQEKFQALKTIQIEEITYTVAEKNIDILIIPASYTYNNQNFIDYLSTGLFFTYTTTLNYNFRIVVDKIFVPIKGVFNNENALNNKILSAINDPQGFVNNRDSEYLYERIKSIEMTLMKEISGKNIDEAIVIAVIKLKKDHPEYTYKEILNDLKDTNFKTSSSEVKAVLAVYFNE